WKTPYIVNIFIFILHVLQIYYYTISYPPSKIIYRILENFVSLSIYRLKLEVFRHSYVVLREVFVENMCDVNLILINLCYHHHINLLDNGGCISLKSKNNWKPNLYDDKIAYVSQYGQGIFDMLS